MKKKICLILSTLAVALIGISLYFALSPKTIEDWSEDAKEGDITAQLYLGECYLRGKDVRKSIEEAMFWFRKAAEQGNADAQSCLGFLLCDNKQDRSKGAYWFRKAAEQGYSPEK